MLCSLRIFIKFLIDYNFKVLISNFLFVQKIDWEKCEAHLEVDRTVDEVDWVVPGYSGGISTLESFINKRLKSFGTKRNDPTLDALSNISPWLHFGNLS